MKVTNALRVKNLLKQWKTNIICLQESKLEFISICVMCSLWECQHVEWCYLASSGALTV
jgi:hypothetical protein